MSDSKAYKIGTKVRLLIEHPKVPMYTVGTCKSITNSFTGSAITSTKIEIDFENGETLCLPITSIQKVFALPNITTTKLSTLNKENMITFLIDQSSLPSIENTIEIQIDQLSKQLEKLKEQKKTLKSKRIKASSLARKLLRLKPPLAAQAIIVAINEEFSINHG